MRTSSIAGRALGLLVFLAGICMLAWVFYVGWRIFEDPGFGSGPDAANVLQRLTVLLVRLAFLLAMCVAGSLVASKGIQLYAAGEPRWHDGARSRPAADTSSTSSR